MKRMILAAAAAAMVCNATPVWAETKAEKEARKAEEKRLGSLYVRCDGQPNNMSEAESFARVLGAITLLGIFAPSPEAPDPSKRLFGEAGVDVCSQLIDGEKPESNGFRRIPLILARALHQIEAKNYQAAVDDVAKARAEAVALNLVGNPYFDRSMGLSFANIEAEALLRANEPLRAQQASLALAESLSYSFVPVITARNYTEFQREKSPASDRNLAAASRLMPSILALFANALEEQGRFDEAAAKREAFIASLEELKAKEKRSVFYAQSAISLGLAGQWEQAKARADFAASNLADRRARGVPETDSSTTVELLDFFAILQLAANGDIELARRNFAARSQWLEPSLGTVMEAVRRLSTEASPDSLTGPLAKSPDDIWQARRDAQMAVKLNEDKDNKSLFRLVWPYAKIGQFEDRSKDTWRIAKSKMMSEKPDEETGLWYIFAYGDRHSAVDSIVLHAALQAKAKGKQGFTMSVVLPDQTNSYYGVLSSGIVRFVDPGEREAIEERYLDADAVIAELSQVIPSPETIKARKNKKRS